MPAGGRPLRCRAALTGTVISESVTVALVVATCVIRFGRVPCPQRRGGGAAAGQPQAGGSSQVSVTCSLYPSHSRSSFFPQRASGS